LGILLREEYVDIMKEVFDNLQEYDERLDHAHIRDYIADLIWYEGVEDTGYVQKNYEHLRDRVEKALETTNFGGPLDWWPT
jgi:hypothetical protein